MEYQVGDKVLIKSLDWYNKNKDKDGDVPCGDYDFVSLMSVFCGKMLTIDVVFEDGTYLMKEDTNGFVFTDEMIKGLVEEEVDLIPKFGEYSDNEPLDVPTMTTDFVKEHGLPCPEGYQFKDENGNEILTNKIILEKKENEYPKTYEECCKILGIDNSVYLTSDEAGYWNDYELGLNYLIEHFRKLLICRYAYWKIAGEEMGLGKPWEPDWNDEEWPDMAYISYDGKSIDKENGFPCCNMILIFPTAEMRDAFKENFDPDIEICKEFL